MSYEIVKSIKIKDDKVFLRSDSNNVYPKHFHVWECTSLSIILKEQGKKELDKEILYQYWSGIFQKTGNNYDKSVRMLTNWHKYNWNYSSYDDPQEVKDIKNNEIKSHLYNNYLEYLNRPKGKFFVVIDEHFLRKKTQRYIFYTGFIKSAIFFNSELDTQYYMRDSTNNYTIIQY